MKKVAFVVYYHKHNFYSFNALIGALEVGVDLTNLDIIFVQTKKDLIQDLGEIVKNYERIVVGISFYTTQFFEISDLIKKLSHHYNNKCLLLAGGPHPTGDPIGTLKMGFDIVVIGEGEETIIEFMNKILTNQDIREIKGIAYIDEKDEFNYTGKRDLIILDDYPPFPLKNTRFGAIEITRGCPYICYFCQTPYISGTHPRHRSVKSITKYIKILKNYYGDHTDVRFITPNAFSYGSEDGKNLNLAKIEELLSKTREIIGKKGRVYFGSFPSEVRPEHVSRATLNLILKYADNDNITIGAQSGSQKILDLCHRGHSIENVYNAVDITLKSNLKVNVDFIYGLPGETEDDINLSIKMMKALANKGAKIHAHSFIPLPQTPYAKEPTEHINDIYKNETRKLIAKGLAFGNWKKQEKLSIKISQYMRKT
ncbi:MAG: TIGR04013 family B12-binding domain/radical SAM domain-containing protein [Promethearchaeota archaeon]|nr:MAG: TIGR04013 family B12-binding domain/radical SAM domain-containing protein [Candidatus Lokiarchaeota archaeon]